MLAHSKNLVLVEEVSVFRFFEVLQDRLLSFIQGLVLCLLLLSVSEELLQYEEQLIPLYLLLYTHNDETKGISYFCSP